MRNVAILTGVVALAAVLAGVGCKKETTVKDSTGGELTLKEPGDVTIERGRTAEVKVKIERKDLHGDVSVAFDNLPRGVTVVDESMRIVGDEGVYILKASDTADLVSNTQAKVTVKGTGGIAVSQMFGITVKGNGGGTSGDSSGGSGSGGGMLTLSKPGDVTIQRGGTAQVKVAIDRRNLTGEVNVNFDDLPKGVTVEDKDKKIAGEEATYTLKASDTADLVANHQVKTTAKAADGPGVTQTFAITVEEKK